MASADPFAPEEFKKPPEEVRRFLREKKLQPSFHYQDISGDEHALAFTVAKSAGYDVLGDIKAALEKAIEERQDFGEFRNGLEPLLKAKGWWGKATQIDPATGKSVEVQLGSARRLKTIYWANVETAYAAGEWERSWSTRRVLPYLEYLISVSVHKRPEHLEQVGTVLPVEDDYWDYWYPPSDWGCQCRVRQISEYEAKQRPNFGKPAPDLGWRDVANKRTGEVRRIPNGVSADWANNPGKFRMKNAADFLAGRLEGMDADMRRVAVADLAGSSLFRFIAAAGKEEGPAFVPGLTDPDNVSRGDLATPFALLPKAVAKRIDAKASTLRLAVRDAQSIGLAPEDYAIVQEMLDTGHVTQDGVVTATIGDVEWRARLRTENDGAAVYLEALEPVK